jgi:biotin transport system permease protein
MATHAMIGVYQPGSSVLHRTRPGVKLFGLGLGLLLLAWFNSPTAVVVGVVVTLGAAAWAGIGARALLTQLRPAWTFAIMVGVLRAWTAGPVAGVTVGASLLVAVTAAGIVTLTTRTQDLLDAVAAAARPLRRIGIDPDRVALTLALAVRSVPVVATLARDVQEARMARGAGRSLRAFAVPLVIRTVRHADRLGEALAARGVDDD